MVGEMERSEVNTETEVVKDKEDGTAKDLTNAQNRVIEWTRPAITALMDGYRNHPCLYDTKHKHYYNKQARKEALEDVLARVRVERPETSVSECQKKFQSLRSYYVQELRKMRKSMESEDQDVYRSCVWWFNQIEFLREHVQVRKSEPSYPNSTGSMGDSLEACELVLPSLGRSSDEGEGSPKRHCPSPRLPALRRDSGYGALSNRELYQVTQGEAFGTFVGSQMNTIEDEELFIMTQSRILQILTEARLKQLEIKSNGGQIQ